MLWARYGRNRQGNYRGILMIQIVLDDNELLWIKYGLSYLLESEQSSDKIQEIKNLINRIIAKEKENV